MKEDLLLLCLHYTLENIAPNFSKLNMSVQFCPSKQRETTRRCNRFFRQKRTKNSDVCAMEEK